MYGYIIALIWLKSPFLNLVGSYDRILDQINWHEANLCACVVLLLLDVSCLGA
jgi:hypothetical protein